jgi:hypothetical protein
MLPGYGFAFRPAAGIFTYFPFFGATPTSDPRAPRVSVATNIDPAPKPAGLLQAITKWTATTGDTLLDGLLIAAGAVVFVGAVMKIVKKVDEWMLGKDNDEGIGR